MAGFVHLHVHTEYSLLDGASRLSEIAIRAKELGMDSLAITDHGNMYGVIDFYKECKQAGIKPILGCEVYVAQRTRHDREPRVDDDPYHLVLLAKDNEGYSNLVRMVSAAHLDGFYYRPRVDRELLEKYSGHLIALSACLGGQIQRQLLAGQTDAARELALYYDGLFGRGNFYLELQDNGVDGQTTVNKALVELSTSTGIPLVATNDVHYTNREDARAHDILLCIQTNKGDTDPDRMRFPGDEFYLKSPREMESLFPDNREAVSATLDIADRCNVSIEFGHVTLPSYRVPEGFTAETYLRHLCSEKIRARYPEPDKRVMDRLEYELGMIEKMGYPVFFLIVWDFIDYAKKQGIPVGPGRGSAAASIVAYILGITDIEPLSANLVFERFLNPERVTLPDFDIDLCFERRQEVIDYVVRKYGEDCVAQIVTFGTMAARAAVRDVGRALQMPYGDVDRIAKLIPYKVGMTLEKALEITPDLRRVVEEDERISNLINLARRLEGMPRHASVHAAGVVITERPLMDYVPLQRSAEGAIVTQFTMETLEELGILKMDFLGLRTLTVIARAVDSIRTSKDPGFDMSAVPMDDHLTYRMLSEGHSLGVFQLESGWVQAMLKEMKPQRFEDIVAAVALVRPGPMEFIPDFIASKNAMPTYLHPRLEPILKDTYGIMIYQEQIMQVAVDMAGMTPGQGDVLRRAVGKKKKELLDQQRELFVTGCIRNGYSHGLADQLYDLIMKFANYGFNRAHAAAYGLVAFQTAYLKAHHPADFMAALLTSIMGSNEKVALYIEECRRMGLSILPPDINLSLPEFSLVGNGIRIGLAAIKNVGRTAVLNIIEQRNQNGPFTSLRDFCERIDSRMLNKRAIESLIKAGVFDSIGARRSQLIAILDRTINLASQGQKLRHNGQMSLFDGTGPAAEDDMKDALPDLDEYTEQARLAMEKELIGLYTSGHPLSRYKDQLLSRNTTPTAEVLEMEDQSSLAIAGLVAQQKRIATRAGDMMLFMTLEDMTGGLEVIVFPKTLQRYSSIISANAPLLVRGRLSVQEEDIKLIAEEIEPLSVERRVHIKVLEKDRAPLGDLLKRHHGQLPVHIHVVDQSRTVAADPRFWVSLDGGFLKEAEKLFGEGSVWVEED